MTTVFPRGRLTAEEDWVVSGWGGDARGGQSTVQIRRNADKHVSATFGEPNGPVLSLDANGTLIKQTGAATISGTLVCSGGKVEISVKLEQMQAKGKKQPTRVSGSGNTTADRGTSWTVAVTPTNRTRIFALTGNRTLEGR